MIRGYRRGVVKAGDKNDRSALTISWAGQEGDPIAENVGDVFRLTTQNTGVLKRRHGW